MPYAIVALLLLCLSFLCFGLLVRTRSRPYGLCHCPYTLAHIKGFGSPYLNVYACLLLCFMLVLASLVLGFATLDAFSGFMVMWLHPTPMRPCLDVTTWDASPWCRLLRAYLSPFSASCDDMLTMLVCATRWLSMHLYTLAYMFMHESCLLVCHPCFNTMKLWAFDSNLHLFLAETTFCLFSCLSPFSLVCLLTCFFACHVYHAYLHTVTHAHTTPIIREGPPTSPSRAGASPWWWSNEGPNGSLFLGRVSTVAFPYFG